MHNVRWTIPGIVVVSMLTACSVEQTTIATCAEYMPFPDPFCLDAGTDAETADASNDDGGGGSSARAGCAGRCTAAAFGNHAGDYMPDPVSVWIGPVGDMPADCVAPVPTRKYRVFKDIIAPPAECDACNCAPSEGKCSGMPSSIEIHAGMPCDPNASALPFGGPAGWDGSCSNNGALAAGAMCNGVPCAQSLWAPVLPGPDSEACAPIAGTPNAKIEPVRWEIGALACQGKPRDEQCPNADETCYEDPGPGWLSCVYQAGIDTLCPDNFWKVPLVFFDEQAIDKRGCEPCTCGDPMGSACYGNVKIYGDTACQVETTSMLVSSMKESCDSITPPGLALGSKKVEALNYMPGTCAASGGAAKGSAAGDISKAVTFCCTSFWDIK